MNKYKVYIFINGKDKGSMVISADTQNEAEQIIKKFYKKINVNLIIEVRAIEVEFNGYNYVEKRVQNNNDSEYVKKAN